MVAATIVLICLLRRDATPDATLQGMFDAFNGQDWKGVFGRFEGAKVDLAVADITKAMAGAPQLPKFSVVIDKVTIAGETAAANVTVSRAADAHSKDGKPFLQADVVHLHQVKGDWKIVGGDQADGLFAEIARVCRDPDSMMKPRPAVQRSIILSNMKQIALALIMYLNDHDDKYALAQANLKSRLMPYIKNDKIWVGPDGKPLDVRINPALIGKKDADLAQPAATVMLSIGSKGNLQFFDGRTPIAYADGHAKLVAKADAATLQWK